MFLVIDCGNINMVFLIWDGEKFFCMLRIFIYYVCMVDVYFIWFLMFIKYYELEFDIKDVIISFIVLWVVFNLCVFVDCFFDCCLLVVGKLECLLLIELCVDEGMFVGLDCLVNVVGVYDCYGGDLIVVDFGIVIIFDVVVVDGVYIGGVILSGVNFSFEVLY